MSMRVCNSCNGKAYLIVERDDGRNAVEACSTCVGESLSDEQAAILARHDGIECSEAYPCLITW